MIEAFESARFLVRQTKSDMERFKVIFNGWINAGRYTTVIEVEPDTGHHIHKVQFSDPVPEDLRAIANNALNNLRHCFDQINSAAYSVANGGAEAPDKFYFPFCTCVNDLEGRLRNATYSNFSEATLDAIRRVQPYPTGTGHAGGNDLFTTFCGAAGRNKHRTTANLNGYIRHFKANQVGGTQIVDMRIPPRWNVAKGEMIIGVTTPEGKIHYDFNLTPEITFGDAEKLTGAPIYRVTLTIAAIAQRLVDELDPPAE